MGHFYCSGSGETIVEIVVFFYTFSTLFPMNGILRGIENLE